MTTVKLASDVKNFSLTFNNVKQIFVNILDYADCGGDNKTREMKIYADEKKIPVITIHYCFKNPNAMKDPDAYCKDNKLIVNISPRIYDYIDYWFTSGKNANLIID